MGAEKGHAAAHSAQAMSAEWHGVNKRLAELAQQQTEIATTLAAFASVQTLAELAVAQQHYWSAASKGGEVAFGLWTAGVRMAHKGMLPLHARATANAKRLATTGQGSGKRISTRR
jgi:hypothetical protein